MISVKLIEVGKPINEYTLEDGSNVGDLFEAAGQEFKNAQVNGANVCSTHVLRDGDRVFIGSKVKGNSDVEVKFMQVGASAVSYPSTSGATIGDLVNSLGASEKAKYVDENGAHKFQYSSITGKSLDSSYAFEASDKPIRIMLGKKVKGNK
jgi:hypothetical protein